MGTQIMIDLKKDYEDSKRQFWIDLSRWNFMLALIEYQFMCDIKREMENAKWEAIYNGE